MNVDRGKHDGYDHKVMGHTRTHTQQSLDIDVIL